MELPIVNAARTLLIDARKLLTDPKNWTQQVAARNAQGHETQAKSVTAVCWCSLGALTHCRPDVEDRAYIYNVAYETLLQATPNGMVASFNDNSTHEEVLELFDRAIARLT
jgi:hypothetical protein